MNWCRYWSSYLAALMVVAAIGNALDRPAEFIMPGLLVVTFLHCFVAAWLWLWEKDGQAAEIYRKERQSWGGE